MQYLKTSRGSLVGLRSCVFFLTIVLLPWGISALDSGLGAMLLIKNAQQGPVRSFATESSSKTIFVGSDDGSVQVWQGDKPDLVQRLQVSNQPILRLASGANDSLIAVERATAGTYKVSVWDWKTGHERFVLDLNEQPLWVTMSPKASFVMLGLARPDSVAYFDAKTGASISWPRQTAGIIDYALISSREERVMTYHAPSGTIAYTELASGNSVARFATRANLRNFQVLPDGTRSKAVALDNQNVVLIDLVNGNVLATTPVGFAPQWLGTDETRPDLIQAAVPTSEGIRTQFFAVKGNSLVAQSPDKMAFAENVTAWIPFLGQNVVGDAGGQSWRFSPGSDPKTTVTFAEKRLSRAIAAGFSTTGLYITTQSGMIRFDGDLFASKTSPEPGAQSPKPSAAPQGPRLVARSITAPAPALGLSTAVDGSFLLWDRDRSPKLYRFDTKTDQVVRTSASLPNPIQRVFTDSANILTVESNGNVRTWSLPDFKQNYFHSSLGNLSGGVAQDGALIIGRGASNDSPLFRIVQKTGETVAVPSSDSAVYLIRANPFDGSLYYLAIQSKNKESLTSLKKLEGTGSGTSSSLISSFPGEDIDADIAFAPGGPAVYTSAGSRNVTVWDGRKMSSLEDTNRVPRQLAVSGSVVAAVNLDGSVSLWNGQTAAHLCDIVLLDSGLIVALTKKAEYYVLPRAASRNSEPQQIAADLPLAESLLGLSSSARSNGINAAVRLVLAPSL